MQEHIGNKVVRAQYVLYIAYYDTHVLAVSEYIKEQVIRRT